MKLCETGRSMDTDYLYRWVTIQLNSGISKSEIINNVMNYAKLSREESEKLVNDPSYWEKLKLSDDKTTEIEQVPTDDSIVSKLSGIENQLKQINKHLDFTYLSWLFIGLGILIGWLIWGL